jgi:hypothetical protein
VPTLICFSSTVVHVTEESTAWTGGVAVHTDKKENIIFLIYKEIQNGAVAKSYVTNGLLILSMGKYFRISSYAVLGNFCNAL